MAQSEPTKRRHTQIENEKYCLVEYVDSDEFSIVKLKTVTFDSDDSNFGSVNSRNKKSYRVRILKIGSKSYIEGKAQKYFNYLSLDTAEEDIVQPIQKLKLTG